jgi:uncharacterized protein (DUF433 family)
LILCYNDKNGFKGLKMLNSTITIDPQKRSGKPCIRDLRITVYDILEMLADGMSTADILEDFPKLTNDDVLSALKYAADREHKTTLVQLSA